MEDRPKGKPRIRDATSDDDVCSASQSLDDWAHAQVSICREYSVADLREGASCFTVGQRVTCRDELIQTIEQIVTHHETHPYLAGEPEPAGDLKHSLCAAPRVYSAGVGCDPDTLLHDIRKDSLHQRNEITCVSSLWIS